MAHINLNNIKILKIENANIMQLSKDNAHNIKAISLSNVPNLNQFTTMPLKYSISSYVPILPNSNIKFTNIPFKIITANNIKLKEDKLDVSEPGQIANHKILPKLQGQSQENYLNINVNAYKPFPIKGNLKQPMSTKYDAMPNANYFDASPGTLYPQTSVPPQAYAMMSPANTPTYGDWNKGKKRCNCSKSQCLKLYCECFANGEFCNNCNCNNCNNNIENEEERKKAIKAILERNPLAFHPKIGKSRDGDVERKHAKGCNCKRSGCLKNYCECYEAKITCTRTCKCIGCKNYEDSYERRTAMLLPPSFLLPPPGLTSALGTASAFQNLPFGAAFQSQQHQQNQGRYVMFPTSHPLSSSTTLVGNFPSHYELYDNTQTASTNEFSSSSKPPDYLYDNATHRLNRNVPYNNKKFDEAKRFSSPSYFQDAPRAGNGIGARNGPPNEPSGLLNNRTASHHGSLPFRDSIRLERQDFASREKTGFETLTYDTLTQNVKSPVTIHHATPDMTRKVFNEIVVHGDTRVHIYGSTENQSLSEKMCQGLRLKVSTCLYPSNFLTDEIIEAIVVCMVAQVQDSLSNSDINEKFEDEQKGQKIYLDFEKSITQEFGQCLLRIINVLKTNTKIETEKSYKTLPLGSIIDNHPSRGPLISHRGNDLDVMNEDSKIKLPFSSTQQILNHQEDMHDDFEDEENIEYEDDDQFDEEEEILSSITETGEEREKELDEKNSLLSKNGGTHLTENLIIRSKKGNKKHTFETESTNRSPSPSPHYYYAGEREGQRLESPPMEFEEKEQILSERQEYVIEDDQAEPTNELEPGGRRERSVRARTAKKKHDADYLYYDDTSSLPSTQRTHLSKNIFKSPSNKHKRKTTHIPHQIKY